MILILLCILLGAGVCPVRGEDAADVRLSLEDCIRVAVENSFEVGIARLDFLIAKTSQGEVESIFDSALSLNMDYTKDRRERLSVFAPTSSQTNTYSVGASKKFPTGTEFTLSFSDIREWDNSGFVTRNPAHTAEVSMEARQPIGKNFFGMIDRYNISITKMAIKNAALDTKERIEALFAEVEKAYWEWAFFKKSLEIYKDLLREAENLYNINVQNYGIGLIEKGELLASRANVILREKEVLTQKDNYTRSEEIIKLLMNMDADYRIYPGEELRYRKRDYNLDECIRIAFQKNRNYQKVKREIEIENTILKIKENEKWPEIDLVASIAANGIDAESSSALDKILSDERRRYYAGVEISIPIENNLARSQFKKSLHNKEKKILNLKRIERSIVTDVGNAFRSYLTFQESMDKVMEIANLQKEKLEEEKKLFRYGRSNTKRLIDYQEDYLHAQLEVYRTILKLEKTRIDLERSMNILLEKYEDML